MATSTAHRDPRAGYTLIELLIVLGIIAVLAGILLTGVFAVRRKVDAVHCTANLLQLGVATRMYIADWHTTPLVYSRTTYSPDVARPPSPPQDHDVAMVLGSYVTSRDVFYCPTSHRHYPGAAYAFHGGASGLRLSQIRTPAGRALIMFDGFDRWTGGSETHGKQNALFLDGHVKGYDGVEMHALWVRNDGSVRMWPYD